MQQASDACRGSFEAHTPVAFVATDSTPATPPVGTLVHQELVVKCAGPTVPPDAVVGPECSTSPPRPNHCDVAKGETFTTGRTYLPLLGDSVPHEVVRDGLTPEAALAELRTIADGLDAEVDAVAKPLQDLDSVVKAMTDAPRTYRLKPAQVKALAKGTLGGRSVAMPPDMRPEIAEELRSLLGRVKGENDALLATPDKASALLEKLANRHARVKVLATAASQPATTKLTDPSATPAEKTTADASVAEIQELQIAARKKLDAIRTHVTELSSQIMQALAKLGDATS